jgi:hypothetical protein
MSLATPGYVQKLQTASHVTSCVFSESRMREICQSGSLPVRFDEREQETELCQTGLRRVVRKHPNSHREAKATAPVLASTRQHSLTF